VAVCILLLHCDSLAGLAGEGACMGSVWRGSRRKRSPTAGGLPGGEASIPALVSIQDGPIERVQRLRGGGLIKKKSKAGHKLRKAKKKGLWWVDDKMLNPQDQNARQQGSRVIDASKKGDIDALRRVLDEGGDVNARVRQGSTSLLLSTPLHLAAYYGHRNIIGELIARRCKVDAVNLGKKTALHVAARQGFAEICQMLINAGANVHAEDADGFTPQDDAEVATFDTEDARKVLQAAGALRHRAYSVLANPGWGGQKARNASAVSADEAGDSDKQDVKERTTRRITRDQVRTGYAEVFIVRERGDATRFGRREAMQLGSDGLCRGIHCEGERQCN
jgi:hypothetical protein